jgi:hypothetical protein
MAVGEVDAIVKYCGRLDPKLEDSGEKLLKAITAQGGAGARNSAEYRQGYDLVSDALAKVDPKQGLAACRNLAVQKDAHHDAHHGALHHR